MKTRSMNTVLSFELGITEQNNNYCKILPWEQNISKNVLTKHLKSRFY